MLDPAHIPPVAPDEVLSRFVLFSKHFRADNTVKPDAFLPHPHTELSVTRHLGATPEEVWAVGQTVATQRKATLYGKAELPADAFLRVNLRVEPAAIAGNPNHANATNWPEEKSDQKLKALELAARATFVRPV